MILFHRLGIILVLLPNVVCAEVFTLSSAYEFQYGVCKEGSNDIAFRGTTRAQCVSNCRYRNECVSLNYDRKTSLCRLHRNNSTLTDCFFPGIVYSVKDTWNIQVPPICSTCGPYKTCTFEDPTINPTCFFEECQEPQNIVNGSIFGNLRDIGSTIRYTCHQGYTMYGPSYRTCLSNGEWSDTEPICCPDGWRQYKGSCYLFDTKLRLSFNKSKNHCSNMEASRLLFIESEEEDTFIMETLEELEEIITDPEWLYFWNGMTLINEEWIALTTNSQVLWLNWLPNEPNNYQNNEECGVVYYSPFASVWGWGDNDCEHSSVPICELQRN